MQNGQPVAYASRVLTDTETRYAQIEKELLAIVFTCEDFEYHQPLVSIVLKPLHKVPSRLQRMLLRLQKFNLKVGYKKGPNMFLADTLSRAHLAEVSACEFTLSLAEVDHTMDLVIPQGLLQELKEAAKQDTVLHAISGTIRQGWPALTSGNCPPLL